MVTLIRLDTNTAIFSSNSIYGIIDLLLINWGNHPDFSLSVEDEKLNCNGIEYELKYIPMNNPRSDTVG